MWWLPHLRDNHDTKRSSFKRSAVWCRRSAAQTEGGLEASLRSMWMFLWTPSAANSVKGMSARFCTNTNASGKSTKLLPGELHHSRSWRAGCDEASNKGRARR